MPPDSLSIVVATGLGISVVAGLVSGVCYIITNGFQQKRYRKLQQRHRSNNNKQPWNCAICGDRFRSIDGVLEVEKVCTCAKCRARICKLKCASCKNDGDVKTPAEWLCRRCHESESWFKGILGALQPRTKRDLYLHTGMEANLLAELDEELVELRKREREKVRDFIERLVSTMLGGDLDEVIITKLYDDADYLPITGDSPCTAHASLKHLIQKFIQEAAELPPLKVRRRQTDDEARNEYNRTYEDLLSTAIINKVIHNYQQEKSVASSSRSSPSFNKRHHEIDEDVLINNNNAPDAKEYFFSKETLDSKWKNSDGMDDSSTSVSSYDDYLVRSESSVSMRYDDTSLTIHQRIEEVSASSSSSEDEREDRRSSVRLVETPDWHDDNNNNWRLQKRQFNGGHSPVPVPMLVPNPTVEAKVLIGDRDAEDTTDLSDAASDYGDVETVPSVNALLLENRTIIGGKNAVGHVDLDEKPARKSIGDEEISEDGSTDAKEMSEEKEDVFSKFLQEKLETKNELLIKSAGGDGSLTSLDSNVEQNLEHTERYATLPRQIEKVQEEPIAKPRSHKPSKIGDNVAIDDKQDTLDAINGGSYSSREKEKWKNAVPMENNPYTKENLERRLSNRSTSSSTGSLYGRDFYVRQAGKAAGASERQANKLRDANDTAKRKETSDEFDREVDEDERAIVPTQINRIKPVDDLQIVRAIPVLVDSTANELPDSTALSLEPATPTRPTQLDVSSDSDISMERVYNLQTGRITQKKLGDVHREVLNGAKSPEGTKYVRLTNDFSPRATDDVVTCNVPFVRRPNANDQPNDEIDSFSLEYSDVDPIDSIDRKQYYKRIHSLMTPTTDAAPEKTLRESKSLNDIEATDRDDELPSVKNLKQLFERCDDKEMIKQPAVYSLTARSIPNALRKELIGEGKEETLPAKETNPSSIDEVRIEANGTEEPEEIVLPSVKNRKAFFENLK